jgi:hypothetical protein
MRLKYLIIPIALLFAPFFIEAQGNKNKDKSNDKVKDKSDDKVKDKDKADKNAGNTKSNTGGSNNSKSAGHNQIIWDGTKDHDGGGPKPSKNQPAKVRAAFQRDYPYVTNVQWSKYRGDWTATFPNGPFFSTAVYHANGQRRDTRTSLFRNQLPPIILGKVGEKYPNAEVDSGTKIEVHGAFKDVFRIKTKTDGTSRYMFFNSDGEEVKYNY